MDHFFSVANTTLCGKICAAVPKPATRGRQFNDSGYQEQGTAHLALSQIEKKFGKGSIMKLGEQAIQGDIAVIPTGSLGLDLRSEWAGCRAGA